MTEQSGVYEHFLGPFVLGELLDPIEHTFRDYDGTPYDLQGDNFQCVAVTLRPDGTTVEYEGQVLSGGRAAALVRPLDQVGLWRVQLWVDNSPNFPDPDDPAFRKFASHIFVFNVGLAITHTP